MSRLSFGRERDEDDSISAVVAMFSVRWAELLEHGSHAVLLVPVFTGVVTGGNRSFKHRQRDKAHTTGLDWPTPEHWPSGGIIHVLQLWLVAKPCCV